MNKYVLCKFSVHSDSSKYNEEKAWCLCKVYSTKKKISLEREIYEFRIKDNIILKASSNFNRVYEVDGEDELPNAAYIPHLKEDGKAYIAVHLENEDEISGVDEILEFEKDEDAILYAELGEK